MADWTNLPNLAVGVGGLPSGTTVTALRDNPIAIAEGAAGAPRVRGTARNHNKLGEITATADVTEVALTDLPAHNDIIIVCEDFNRGADDDSITAAIQISDNNGSSWVSLTSTGLRSPPASGARALIRVFTGWGGGRSFRVGTNFSDPGSQATAFQSGVFSFSGQVNAVRVSRTAGSGTIGIGAKLEVYALAEGYLP